MLNLIVAIFDETAFLRSALRSVHNQDIDDLELIVVNDNPDRFTEADLARLTSGLDARIIQHRKNRGLSAARNTGIGAANGDWIGFLDADDYFTHRGLAEQLDYARETGADITHATCYLGAESSVHTSLLPRDARLHMDRRVVTGHMAAQEAQFIVSSWSSLSRSDLLSRNALWFDPERRKFEDRLFVLNAVTAARRIAFLGRGGAGLAQAGRINLVHRHDPPDTCLPSATAGKVHGTHARCARRQRPASPFRKARTVQHRA
jgi:glycosyltransferase involved in cell wall biosynthesis